MGKDLDPVLQFFQFQGVKVERKLLGTIDEETKRNDNGMANIVVCLAMVMAVPSLNEKKRFVKDDTEYLEATMEDFRSDLSLRQGRKRKVDDCQWMEEGERLIRESKRLLSHPFEGLKSFCMGVKVRWDLYHLGDAIIAHTKEGDLVLEQALSEAQGPSCGIRLPVKQLVGEVASGTLDRLKCLFAGDEVGRIIIHGIEGGIGKTHMMKHLHNYALNLSEYDYVFWVSSPVDFSIKSVQDAIAAAVHCDFASDDDIFERARKLSRKFANLSRFAIFLDGVLKADFSVEEIGIPVPAEGSKCKLVLATSSRLERSSKLNSFEKVEIEKLSDDDAYTLFVREANIQVGSVSSLGRMPRSLSDSCGGVPRRILNLATRMCNIDDPREWRCALFELREFGEKKKCLRSHLGESETTPSTSKARVTRNSKK